VQEQPRDWDWDELNLQYAAAEDALEGISQGTMAGDP